MGGTFDRDDNIGGRVIFLLEPGYLQDEQLVSDAEKIISPQSKSKHVVSGFARSLGD